MIPRTPETCRFRRFAAAVGLVLLLLPMAVRAGTLDDAVAREFSLFAGSPGPVAVGDAVTREFSLFAGSPGPIAVGDAVTREFSLFVGNVEVPILADAVTREFSLLVPRPDLQAVSFSAPPDSFSLTTETVSWTVENTGPATASGTWTDQIFLSPNDTFSAGDPILVSLPFTGTLEPGQSYTRTTSLPLPLVEGSYTLFLLVNAGQGLDEGGEWNNNLLQSPLEIEYGPLPDLVPGTISGPPNALPGETVEVSWTTTNTGDAPAAGPWTEQVFLSTDSTIGNDRFLASFSYEGSLAPDESAVRTETVTIPLFGLASDGSLGVVVKVDTGNAVVESNTANNAAIAVEAIEVPRVLRLTLPVASIPESAADPVVRATLTRSGSTASPLTVALAGTAPDRLDVPASVVMEAGASTVVVPLTVLPDGVTAGDALVDITASAAGFVSAGASLLIIDTDTPVLEMAIDPPTLSKGSVGNGVVSRLGAPTGETLIVALASTNPARLSVPSSVTIPSGESSAAFTVTAVENFLYLQPRVYSVTASASGFSSVTQAVNVVEPLPPPAFEVAVTPDRIDEDAANPAATGTLTLDAPRPHDLRFNLHTSHPDRAQVPTTVTVFRETTQATFPVNAIDNDLLDGDALVTLTATLADGSGGAPFSGSTATAFFEVIDDDGPRLRIALESGVAPEGVTLTATLTRNADFAEPLTVFLETSDVSIATVPASVSFPAGADTVEFFVTTIDDGMPDGSRAVDILASADGFATGSAHLVVTDIHLPDLVVSTVSAPASVLTGENFQVTYRIKNQGIAAATGSWEQQVLRSDNPLPGGDLPLGAFRFTGTLEPGQSFERTVTFIAPSQAGEYWIVVRTDAGNEIEELFEDNNTRVSAQPILVADAYTAVVSANIDTAPAGTPVVLSGQAVRAAGGPAGNVIVSIHISVRDTQRTIAALTDANGNFSVVWTPLPGEAGFYSVAATHPGRLKADPQDSFTLLGFSTEPSRVALDLIEGADPKAGLILVRNLANVPLTGLSATILDEPENLALDLTIGDGSPDPSVGPLGVWVLHYTATALDASITEGTATLRLSSAEGAVLDLPVDVRVRSLRSRLVADPQPLLAGVLRGDQRVVAFSLSNEGGAPTGPVRLVLPGLPWLSAATPILPSIAPGATVPVNLILSPPDDTVLGPFTGTISVRADDSSLNLPFEFRVISDGVGDLRVEAVNELTYYATGSPRVEDATVRVTNAYDDSIVFTAATDADGFAEFTGLPEGYYHLHVSAPDHHSHRATVFIGAGAVRNHLAFLSWQTVRYTWTVVPTEIEDRTRIIVESVFETNVPVPVITVEPSYIDLDALTDDVTQIDITITNHGWIAASNMRLFFNDHARWSFEPITDDIGTLPALSSVRIPVVFRKIPEVSGSSSDGMFQVLGGGGCGGGGVLWNLLCGTEENSYSAGIGMGSGGCGGGAGGGGGGGGGGYGAPVGFSGGDSNCDPCLPIAIAKCLIGYTPIGCPFGLIDAAISGDVIDAIIAILGCATGGAASAAFNTVGCAKGISSCQAGGAGGGPGGGSGGPGTLASTGFTTLSDDGWLHVHSSPGATLDEAIARMETITDLYAYILGDPVWMEDPDGDLLSAWLELFFTFAQEGTEDGRSISANERIALLNTDLPVGVTIIEADRFIERWHRTLDYNASDIYDLADVPAGWSTDFIAADVLAAYATTMESAYLAAAADGFADPLEGFISAKDAYFQSIDGAGICARVRIQIEQEAVITRDGFKATLEIANESAALMDEVLVSLYVLDDQGQDRTSLFGIRPPELSGLTGVDGEGMLPMESTGRGTWTIIPTSEAAPDEPLEYFVGGTLHYRQAGLLVTVPLVPAPITVYPSAALQVRYFHQRDVFANDPWTDVIEPSIPFSLGVMVSNSGNGVARNVRINSSQPKIVENEKGLFIDFQIIATEVAGQPLSPGLTANFGDILPGQRAIGRWLLTSTLQGLFISYDATFEHLDGLGDPRLSLIESVSIHEMIRAVRAPGAQNDGLPDFLVNDIPDSLDLPDTLYLSDGRIEPVGIGSGFSFGAAPTAAEPVVTLTASVPVGFVYFAAPDPGNGFRLVRVVRSDGTDLLTENFWQTDRTFLGLGQRPVREDRIHIFDFESTGSYELHYEPPQPTDLTPPVSSVDPLPAESFDHFIVSWEGTDDLSGVALFDIFVSEDGGPFLPWIVGTTGREAIFEGELGKAYAFYSVATDAAGNREATPSAAQAETLVTLTNSPPVLGPLPDRVVDERQTLTFIIAATDPDADDALTFTLEPGAPAGVTLHPSTGRLTWATGETHGGQTYTIGVRVTDSGLPALSDIGTFDITVNEVNHAPVLNPIADRVTFIGQPVTFTAIASDSDLPAQTLTFSLGPDAPADAHIDPESGAFAWTPLSPGAFGFTVTVTDDGAPPLSASRDFLITVNAENTPPVITLQPFALAYSEGDGVVRIDPFASLTDPDSIAFGGGELLIDFAIGPQDGDALGVRDEGLGAGRISLDGENTIRFGSAVIGTFLGGGEGGGPLTAFLTENATLTATRALIRNITFVNNERFPDATPRFVRFVLAESDGTTSEPAVRELRVTPVNEDPVAGPDMIGVAMDTPVEIPLARLLRNDFDPDEDPIEIELPATITARGGAVTLGESSVTYTPPPAFTGRDTFHYTLSDPYGGEATGIVTAIVRAPDDGDLTLVTLSFEAPVGEASPVLIGLPDRTYSAIWSSDLLDWDPVGTFTSDSLGELSFTHHPGPSGDRRFYRFSLQP
ncbi:MAG: carboxypeptidase regulatory-like domain-containing protein [Opitutales bacterium]|nr:carboxypeptidase regulatory-like domain-containing protein [Opitutales bacterium]